MSVKTPSAAEIAALPYRLNVGVMLMNADGKVFVGMRIDNPDPAWQMPQGGIDKGEDPLPAALREMEEEIGVPADAVEVIAESADWISYDLPVELLHKLWHGKYRGQKQKWFLLRLKAGDEVINIETDHPEFREWCWLDHTDLADKIVPFKRAVYEAVVAEFAPLIRPVDPTE